VGGALVVSYAVSRATRVTLELYSMNGRTSIETFSGTMQPGQKSITWRPKLRQIGTGAYIAKMNAGDVSKTQRVMFAK
jgi:hypothetical protein